MDLILNVAGENVDEADKNVTGSRLHQRRVISCLIVKIRVAAKEICVVEPMFERLEVYFQKLVRSDLNKNETSSMNMAANAPTSCPATKVTRFPPGRG